MVGNLGQDRAVGEEDLAWTPASNCSTFSTVAGLSRESCRFWLQKFGLSGSSSLGRAQQV